MPLALTLFSHIDRFWNPGHISSSQVKVQGNRDIEKKKETSKLKKIRDN
jgi:hypothetical protein